MLACDVGETVTVLSELGGKGREGWKNKYNTISVIVQYNNSNTTHYHSMHVNNNEIYCLFGTYLLEVVETQ